MSDTATLLSQYMCAALRRRLDLDEMQVFPAIAPDFDPLFKGDLTIELVPGPATPDGEGEGAQEGGALLTRQTFTLWVFYRCKLDQYGHSEMLLIEAGRGLLDLFQTIRQLFAFTCFPTSATPGPSDFLLYRPMQWAGESETLWEDAELYIARRSMAWRACYAATLPDQPTVGYADYT